MFRAVEAVYKANRSLLTVRNYALMSNIFRMKSKRTFLETEGDRDEPVVTQGAG
jgi:hypothetical protein